MAAVVLREGEDFDCSDTYKQVVNYLPSYARPRFIRVQVRQEKRAFALPLVNGVDVDSVLFWIGPHCLEMSRHHICGAVVFAHFVALGVLD